MGLDEGGGEQGDHDLVMAGDGIAVAAGAGVGPLDDVEFRAVVLQEIEIRGGEIRERISQIADHGNGLQEDFRQQDRGADIEINAAIVHFFY